MTRNRWFACLILFLLLLGQPPAFAQSAKSSATGNDALKSLIQDLQQAIDDADKRMVAHPRFLDELRALVERYRANLREVFFYDDFKDGDFTKNPNWAVKSGRFRVIPAGRLWSSVTVDRPSGAPSSKEPEPFEILLKELIRTKETKKEKMESAPKEENAFIQTLARIAPAFEVDLNFLSESTWGAMEVVLLGGNPAAVRYRLIYHAAPSQERPIEIVRERNGRQYTIEAANRFPALDNGAPHRLQWIRNAQGEMKVLIDGLEVLSTVELFYKTEFSGLGLGNQGGTYEWGPIKVLQAPVQAQP